MLWINRVGDLRNELRICAKFFTAVLLSTVVWIGVRLSRSRVRSTGINNLYPVREGLTRVLPALLLMVLGNQKCTFARNARCCHGKGSGWFFCYAVSTTGSDA